MIPSTLTRRLGGALLGGALLAASPFFHPDAARAAASPQTTHAPAGLPVAIPSGGTLEAVRHAGLLRCAVVSDEDDYSEDDQHGNLSAFGADLCRAMAAEVLGDPRRARFVTEPDTPEALKALRTGRAEVMFGATPDPVIAAVRGLRYGPPAFFDGQGFLVRRAASIRSPAELSGRNLCFINAAPAERTLYDGLDPTLAVPEHRLPFSERGEMVTALLDGHCDGITGDVSWLGNVRAGFGKRAAEFAILDQTISIDPWSPTVRGNDPAWAAIVDWTVWALVQAEAHGVTRANVTAMRSARDPVARRLAGEPWLARTLGLDDGAFARALTAVGNYGELYDRDVGPASPLALPVGRNQPAERGGLLWALPVQPEQ